MVTQRYALGIWGMKYSLALFRREVCSNIARDWTKIEHAKAICSVDDGTYRVTSDLGICSTLSTVVVLSPLPLFLQPRQALNCTSIVL